MIGPYPYTKFALVENFWETGYGMPSFTLLGPQIIRFPFILTSSYPHEILHNWWGNSRLRRGNPGQLERRAHRVPGRPPAAGAARRDAVYRRSTLQKYRDYVSSAQDFPLVHSVAATALQRKRSVMDAR